MEKTNTTFKAIIISVFICFAAVPVMGQLSITKVAPAYAAPGDTIVYKLIYKNVGSAIQHNVVIEDHLPLTEGTYIGSSPEGSLDTATGTIRWTKNQIPEFNHLNAGEGVVYVYGIAGRTGAEIDGNINNVYHYYSGYYISSSPHTLTNTAYIHSDETPNPVGSNASNTTITQVCTASISQASGVVKSASNSEYRYVVALTNTGNVWNKWDLNVQNLSGGQQLSINLQNFNGSTITSTPWIPPGATYTFIFYLYSPSGTNPSIGTPQDPNYSRITATPIPCGAAVTQDFVTEICGGQCSEYTNISLYKYDMPDPVQSGNTLTYTVQIYNPADASKANPYTNVLIKEIYPANAIFLSASRIPEAGTNNSWLFPTLPFGLTTFTVTLQLSQNIPNNSDLINRVELYDVRTAIPVFVNYFEEHTLVKSSPDLYIDKTANPVVVEPGDIVTYKLAYGNTGNYFGEDVEIIDNYDEHYMTPIISTLNGGTVSNGNIIWNFANIPIGTSDTITYQLQVRTDTIYNPGTTFVLNTSHITVPNTVVGQDNDLNDNYDYATIQIRHIPDLKIEKTAAPATAKAFDNLTYTLSVSNIGDIDHTGGTYVVTDTIPSNLTYISSSPGGNYNASTHTVTWIVTEDLAVNAIKTFTIAVNGINCDMGGTNLVNRAYVLSDTWNDKDLTNNKFTLTTPVEICANLWIGTESNAWATANNWLKKTVPLTGEDVIFATTSNYNIDALNDLHLDQNRTIGDLVNLTTNRKLVITKNNTLVVNRKAVTTNANSIQIESELNAGNGALVFKNPSTNTGLQATVEFDSKSQKLTTGAYPRLWQFIGTPVSGANPISVFGNDVVGGKFGSQNSVLIRKYNEAKNDPTDLGDKWDNVDVNSPMLPFTGYEVAQPTTGALTYNFVGALNIGDFSTGDLGFTSGAYYRGNYVLANSYVAPIDINSLQDADFVNLEKTIYLYNTGSRDQWLVNDYGTSSGNPGTYFSVPVGAAPTLGVYQIPSINGFMVRRLDIANGYTSANPIRFNFRYATLDTLTTTPTQPMLVKSVSTKTQEANNKYPMLMVDVKGTSGVDRVHLLTVPNTTGGFDNGWDGTKYRTQTDAQIYALTANADRYQVSSSNDLNGTILGLYNGTSETEFTLTFHFVNMENVYRILFIEDLQTGAKTEITDGVIFRFNVSSTSPEARFRISGMKESNLPTDLNNPITITYSKSKNITVQNDSKEKGSLRIFDIAGKILYQQTLSVGFTDKKINLQKGVYIVEAETINNRSSLKIIVQ